MTTDWQQIVEGHDLMGMMVLRRATYRVWSDSGVGCSRHLPLTRLLTCLPVVAENTIILKPKNSI